MAKILTINLPDELEQALTSQAESLNQSPEEVVLHLLSQQLPLFSRPQRESLTEDDPILKLMGSIQLEEIHDLGENHDEYIGQILYRELGANE